MLSIYWCDDNKEQLEENCSITEKFILFKDWDICLKCACTSPAALLLEKKNHEGMGLYFLDIDLKSHMNGFDLAGEIRKLDPRGFIVFVTTHSEWCHLPYEYNLEAMHYIIKDDPKRKTEQIKKSIETAYERYQALTISSAEYLEIASFGNTTWLNKDDIIYIRTSGIPHQIEVVHKEGVLSVYKNLSEIESHLGASFFRIHKSTLINVKHILEISRSERVLHLTGKNSLTASAPRLRVLLKYLSKR